MLSEMISSEVPQSGCVQLVNGLAGNLPYLAQDLLDKPMSVPSIAVMHTHTGSTTGTEMRLHWEAQPSDEKLAAIVELLDCAADDGGLLGHTQPMNPGEAAAFTRALRHKLSSGLAHALLGEVSQELIFFCLMTPNPLPTCRHRAELSKGILHPDYRRQHLMPAVAEAVSRKAEALQIEQLVLDVRENSHAHRVWQALGFRSYGVLDDYARANGRVHRGHFMCQSVAALHRHAAEAAARPGA